MAARIPVPAEEHSSTPLTGEEQRQELERVLGSSCFLHAPGLQKFLEYVADKTIRGLSHEIKEYAIGAEALDRSAEYDPRIDTTVRVQARRLREKLKEYYEGEGAAGEIVIDLPKGQYVPRFLRRSQTVSFVATSEATRPDVATAPSPSSLVMAPTKRFMLWLAIGAGGAVLFASGVLLAPWVRSTHFGESHAPGSGAAATGSVRLGEPLGTLWANFCCGSDVTIVAYRDEVFLATETSDLLRLRSGELGVPGAPAVGGDAPDIAENPRLVSDAGPVSFSDGYTGSGQVMAVHELAALFSSANKTVKVQKSRSITSEDLRDYNVVFVGSTLRDPVLGTLPLSQNFVFDRPPHPPTLWRTRIVNLHPLPGESPFYEIERDDKTHTLRADYALVSFLPGITAGRKIVVLGGLTTAGVEGAARFVTSSSGAAELVAHLGVPGKTSSKKLPSFFQALVKVETRNGEILRLTYVTGRAIESKDAQP
jgi:hypothetical protein